MRTIADDGRKGVRVLPKGCPYGCNPNDEGVCGDDLDVEPIDRPPAGSWPECSCEESFKVFSAQALRNVAMMDSQDARDSGAASLDEVGLACADDKFQRALVVRAVMAARAQKKKTAMEESQFSGLFVGQDLTPAGYQLKSFAEGCGLTVNVAPTKQKISFYWSWVNS